MDLPEISILSQNFLIAYLSGTSMDSHEENAFIDSDLSDICSAVSSSLGSYFNFSGDQSFYVHLFLRPAMFWNLRIDIIYGSKLEHRMNTQMKNQNDDYA